MHISTTNKVILGLLTAALVLALVARFLVKDEVAGTDDQVTTEPAVYKDLIKVSSPLPQSTITSPLTITGEARGMWYFEASFPIVVVNWDGLIIGEGFATANGDWMTEEYVPFTATITFDADTSVSPRGSIILQKSNASGLPENDDAFEYEINFAPVTAVGTESDAGFVALAGSAWEWLRTDRAQGAATVAPAGKFVLTFNDDKSASSATDCNSMSGSYVVDGEVLSFGPMVTTLMFCENSVETFYANDLAAVNSYVITGDTMIMNLNRGAGTMHFKRKE